MNVALLRCSSCGQLSVDVRTSICGECTNAGPATSFLQIKRGSADSPDEVRRAGFLTAHLRRTSSSSRRVP